MMELICRGFIFIILWNIGAYMYSAYAKENNSTHIVLLFGGTIWVISDVVSMIAYDVLISPLMGG